MGSYRSKKDEVVDAYNPYRRSKQIQPASSDFNTDGRVTWVEIEEDLEGNSDGEIVPDTKFEEDFPNQKGEQDSVGQGGSILQLIDDLVKVGETIGYDMKGCMKNMEEIIELQGANDDYFVMVRGDWMPNGKKFLIISVYASQELSEKKMLWDYLSLVMSKWEGEVVIIGTWIDSPSLVKSEFMSHFKNRFEQPNSNRLHMNMHFSNTLSSVQFIDLECQVSKEEIKKAVWDCGIDKSPGPDGFTFGCCRRYWKLIENDAVDAVTCFFHQCSFPKGGNSSFIILIPKTPNANMVKDYRPISLIGSMYKIISKILANRLVVVLGGLKKKQSLVFKVDFEKAYDSVRWDHLDDIMMKFGYGEKWLLDCFNRASGLRINMTKSKLLGISVKDDKVKQAAANIGCNTLKTPFSYLGSKVGGCMSRIQSWNETIERMACRLSKWKLKTLSIGGRLTLLKFVLGSMPIYHMSLYKVPKKVLHRMESMRSHFFNGAELSSKKSVWVKWKHALASKDKGGLGVSSLFALNKALMFKWVWHFITQGSSLWARVIKALYGYNGKIGQKVKSCYPSLWLDIIHEVEMFKSRGSGEFTITLVMKMIDDFMLPEVPSKTRWIKAVPIKAVESTSHILFTCQMSKEILRKISRWWDIDYMEISSYEEWLDWILNTLLSVKSKQLFEGVYYVLWSHVWSFRNKTIFGSQIPSKATIFDDVVSRSFLLVLI
nr:RNA-directed DNA polymerase, eukaryota, reverse transcriptase zinc-binding domain protein [Tanacetum cinerariifolium]